MPHRFMQQNAGPARSQHHRHLARRGFDRAQLHDGLAGGFASEVLRRLVAQEEIERDPAAAARVAVLRNASVFARQHRDVQASHGLAVEAQATVAGGDQNLAHAVGIAGLHLENALIVGPRGAVGALDQIDALGQSGFVRALKHGIEIMFVRFLKAGLDDAGRTLGDARGDSRGLADLVRTQIVAIGVAGALADEDADAHAQLDSLRGALDDAFVDADGAGGQIFEIQVGVLASGR